MSSDTNLRSLSRSVPAVARARWVPTSARPRRSKRIDAKAEKRTRSWLAYSETRFAVVGEARRHPVKESDDAVDLPEQQRSCAVQHTTLFLGKWMRPQWWGHRHLSRTEILRNAEEPRLAPGRVDSSA